MNSANGENPPKKYWLFGGKKTRRAKKTKRTKKSKTQKRH
jgi:hypothetical protein